LISFSNKSAQQIALTPEQVAKILSALMKELNSDSASELIPKVRELKE
jgi:hypothetical protein